MKNLDQGRHLLLGCLMATAQTVLASPTGLLDAANIKAQLSSFHANPSVFMDTVPQKTKAAGKRPGPEDLESFWDQRQNIRDRIIGQKAQARPSTLEKSSPNDNDHVDDLVETEHIITQVDEMERLQLMQAQVATQPWSDDYWPIYKGILGARYAKREFHYIDSWKEGFDYIQTHPAQAIFKTGKAEEIDLLSPAEKYDLLLSADQSILSQKMWQEGKHYYDNYGEVESWMGICHGWAPASYMMPRPQKKVTVMAADGKTPITFYPSDIKALASLLWANAKSPTNFIGGRCNDKDPAKDENGRITSSNCFDSNPGTWHMSVVNQVGVDKRSMVMDATYDYQVWNQPIISYEYTYFNPEGQERFKTLEQAKIDRSQYHSDKFKRYRSTKAKYIVGIAMQVTYGVEISPRQRPTESEQYDANNSVLYLYDLELDEHNQIIGGEWYNNAHPDFLWTPPSDGRALSIGDYSILNDGVWSGRAALSERWKTNGIYAARSGQPLQMIVQSLIKLSNQ